MADPNYDHNKNKSILQVPTIVAAVKDYNSTSSNVIISSSNNVNSSSSAGITRRFIPKVPADKNKSKIFNIEDEASTGIVSSSSSSSGNKLYYIILYYYTTNFLKIY